MHFTSLTRFLSACGLCLFPMSLMATEHGGTVRVADYLPSGYVSDGSVCYQTQIQQALNAVPDSGGEVVFPPIMLRIDDPAGFTISSNLTLRMYGATFQFAEECSEDGQLFYGQDVSDVRFLGGSVYGRNDVWASGTNIRGIYLTGACQRILIRDMFFQDLSSNGVGVFGSSAEQPATDITLVDSIIDHCCNVYGDYMAPPPTRRGPEQGSRREDQGLVAFYHVHDFSVRGCRFEDSRSDGTHFCYCERGQFSDNRVYRSKMGGYFVESSRHILATGNVIRDNGSRGCTIERGSQFCTLIGNTVEGSGREGLWIPDSLRCVVTDNVFSLNGRKPNGTGQNRVWNANITINEDKHDPMNAPTSHYLIADNIIESDQHQIAAIRVDTRSQTTGIVIQDNLFVGENQIVLVEGTNQAAVIVKQDISGSVRRSARSVEQE